MDNGEILKQILIELKDLKQGQVKLEQGQVKLEQGQVKLEQMIMDTKESVVIIENDHGRQIGALFDGQSRIHDMLEEVLETVQDILAKLERHDIEIALLTESLIA